MTNGESFWRWVGKKGWGSETDWGAMRPGTMSDQLELSPHSSTDCHAYFPEAFSWQLRNPEYEDKERYGGLKAFIFCYVPKLESTDLSEKLMSFF